MHRRLLRLNLRFLHSPLGRRLTTIGLVGFALFLAAVCTDEGLGILGGALDSVFNPARVERLTEVSAIAVRLERETGYPAAVLVGQWALETGWGAQPACTHNYFGIKFDPGRHTLSCTVATSEAFNRQELASWERSHGKATVLHTYPDGSVSVSLADRFADYASLEDSCRDYVSLVEGTESYRAAWSLYQQTHDAERFAALLARQYATSPDYAKTLHSIAFGWTVQNAVSIARQPQTE